MSRLLLISIIVLSCHDLFGQDCSQKLEEARRAYFNGGFDLVLSLLTTDCIQESLEGEAKTDAFRLVIQSHLMLGQDSLADAYTNQLLQIAPLYKVRSTDISRFKRLVESYQIKTRFKVGIGMGISFPDFKIMQYQSYASQVEEPERYDPLVGFTGGINIEVPVYKSISLASGVFYQSFAYTQSEIILDYQKVSVKEKFKYLTFPIALKWKVDKWKIKPFVSAGFNFHRLINSKADISLFTLPQDSPVPYTGIPQQIDGYDISQQRKDWTTNYLFGAGVAKSFGLNELEIALNYEHGKNNLVEEKNRYTDPVPYRKYSYVSDDFKMNQIRIMVSFTHSLVKAKKLGK